MYCSSTNFFHFSTPLNADVIYVSSLVVEGVADLPHLLRVLTHDFAPRGEQAPRAEGRGGRLGLRQGSVFLPALLRSVRRDTLAFVRLLCIPASCPLIYKARLKDSFLVARIFCLELAG